MVKLHADFQLTSNCQTSKTTRLAMENRVQFHPVPSQRRDSSIKAALLKAVNQNNVENLQRVLATKSWPVDNPHFDYDLLVKAIDRGFKTIANVLLDHGARAFKGLNLNTPLHLAAAKSNDWLDVIERLVERGARVSDTKESYTPLHVAFRVGPTSEKIDLLLRLHLRHSDENVISGNGLSLLHIACSRPHLQFVRKLAEANKETVDKFTVQSRCTALHFAVEFGRHEIADYLVRHGADLYCRNYHHSTPIHVAMTRRDIAMIDVLLAYAKDRQNLVNKYNLSHFMAACIGSKVGVVEDYLETAECRYETPAQVLIDARINNRNAFEGYAALHFAVDLGTVEVVELLLSRGAHCCLAAASGHTPHLLAERRGRADMIDVLKEHCCVVNNCLRTRAESPDYGKYGAEYERYAVVEQTRELKYLRETLRKLESMSNLQIVPNYGDSKLEDL